MSLASVATIACAASNETGADVLIRIQKSSLVQHRYYTTGSEHWRLSIRPAPCR